MGAWQQNTHGIFQHNCRQTAIVMEKSSKPHELIHLIVPFTSAMMEENRSKVVDTWDKYLRTQSTLSYIYTWMLLDATSEPCVGVIWPLHIRDFIDSRSMSTVNFSRHLIGGVQEQLGILGFFYSKCKDSYRALIWQLASNNNPNQNDKMCTRAVDKNEHLLYLQIQKMIPLIDVFQNAIMVRQKWLVWTA